MDDYILFHEVDGCLTGKNGAQNFPGMAGMSDWLQAMDRLIVAQWSPLMVTYIIIL